jgi:hypothetical protein
MALACLNGVAPTSTAWPSANHAFYIPWRVPVPVTVYKMATGSGATTGSNNFDVGIYDCFGNRLVSSGATAKGNSVEHIIDVTDTRIGPGLYYLAMSADNTGNYVMVTPAGTSPVPLQKVRLYGVLQQASAYTLPNPATFAASTQVTIPSVSVWFRYY